MELNNSSHTKIMTKNLSGRGIVRRFVTYFRIATKRACFRLIPYGVANIRQQMILIGWAVYPCLIIKNLKRFI